MNICESDVLMAIGREPYVNQRLLSDRTGHSLGMVNRALGSLQEGGYLTGDMCLTEQARRLLSDGTPKNAIILAAGFGMRMVPVNTEAPKAFVEIDGEPLIERIIGQLREAGVQDITVVVGFMKERFEYLMDKYHVRLAVNRFYAAKNNLCSLALVADSIDHTYIVPSDLWCAKNPFRAAELYAWYMVSDRIDDDSTVRVTRKRDLALISASQGGNAMAGICYLAGEAAALVRSRLQAYSENPKYDAAFWEETLYGEDRMIVRARVVPSAEVVEINTYEQLRALDGDSDQLKSDAITAIQKALRVSAQEITDITVLKKGMTNRSFLFRVDDQKYIMRIPGEGTDQLINRAEEADVYEKIRNLGICDDLVYINPANGYKITKYLKHARVCDPENEADLQRCMARLRAFHALNIQVDHSFDIFGKIDFYESLWEGAPSAYADYATTKRHVRALQGYIEAQVTRRCLTHVDAVPDNFLFTEDGDLRLIDWEYAGMQDPHVDIAMFCIYALYDRAQVDRLIDIYFENKCDRATRLKIYCYIAACGLLWSNWCEFKRNLGVEFGEYSLRQYRYAKDYYRLFMEEQDA